MSGVGGVGRTIGMALQDVAGGGGQGNGKTPIHTEGQGGDGTRGTHGNQDGGRAWGANGRGPADLSSSHGNNTPNTPANLLGGDIPATLNLGGNTSLANPTPTQPGL